MRPGHQPENEIKSQEAHPSLGKSTEADTLAAALATAAGATNLTAVIKAINGIKRGAYTVRVCRSTEWNEVQVKLYESTIRVPIATAFIDLGHTKEDRRGAMDEIIATARAHLRTA